MAKAMHINKPRRWRGGFIPRLMRLRLELFLLAGLVANFVCLIFFALVYFAAGEVCYGLSDGVSFDLMQMVMLSAQVFTTVGFGNVFPTCIFGQVVVALEHFCAVSLAAVIMAVLIAKFLEPQPSVRCTEKILITDEGDFNPKLSLRMVRSSATPLLNCRAELVATLNRKQGRSATNFQLELESSRFIHFEQCVLVHAITEDSPLHDRWEDVRAFHLTITVYDSKYHKDVMLFKTWERKDLVRAVRWNDMIDTRKADKGGDFIFDHSKLDLFTARMDV